MASVDRRANGTWQARYRPVPGATQITRTFARKVDAIRWLTEQAAALAEGRHIHPATAKLTVGQWCDQWLGGLGREDGAAPPPARLGHHDAEHLRTPAARAGRDHPGRRRGGAPLEQGRWRSSALRADREHEKGR